MIRALRIPFAAFVLLGLAVEPASADRIKNPTAAFAGLDKITGRIISFEVNVDETVQFGSLQLTPRVCYSRPPYEAPQTTSFIEVDEIGAAKDDSKRIFTGWMFAASPGLSAIDHAVYDIWLTDCKGGTDIIKTPLDQPDAPVASLPNPNAQPPKRTPASAQANAAPKRPTQRYFPTNEPPPPAQAGPRVPSTPFDPASRGSNN